MSITLDSGTALAQTAIRIARAQGINIACCIVNDHGFEIAALRMERAGWVTTASARAKARTAAIMRMDTANCQSLADDYPELIDIIDDELPFRFTTLAGGVALRRDGKFVGALGVSGATPDQDLAIARAAVDEWLAS